MVCPVVIRAVAEKIPESNIDFIKNLSGVRGYIRITILQGSLFCKTCKFCHVSSRIDHLKSVFLMAASRRVRRGTGVAGQIRIQEAK